METHNDDLTDAEKIFELIKLFKAFRGSDWEVFDITNVDFHFLCFKNKTKEEMCDWFESMVDKIATSESISITEAEEKLSFELGMRAESIDDLGYLYHWLNIKHPLFGTPDEMRQLTKEQMHNIMQEYKYSKGMLKKEIAPVTTTEAKKAYVEYRKKRRKIS